MLHLHGVLEVHIGMYIAWYIGNNMGSRGERVGQGQTGFLLLEIPYFAIGHTHNPLPMRARVSCVSDSPSGI